MGSIISQLLPLRLVAWTSRTLALPALTPTHLAASSGALPGPKNWTPFAGCAERGSGGSGSGSGTCSGSGSGSGSGSATCSATCSGSRSAMRGMYI